jgi:hypothetical protein
LLLTASGVAAAVVVVAAVAVEIPYGWTLVERG